MTIQAWIRANCKFATYSTDLAMFRDYMQHGPDPYDFSHHLPLYFEEVHGKYPKGFDPEEPYEHLEKMSPKQLESFKNWILKNPPEAGAHSPTYMHMDYKQLLPRETWLVHFSNQAEDISNKGFEFGHEDFGTLGLTTYFTDKVRMKGQGWNFAFDAFSRDAVSAANQGRYGRNAVLFQSAGVQAWHYGDEENQVVFKGASVKEIVPIYRRDEEWEVNSNRDGRVLYKGDFQNVVLWVSQNYAQYRNVLAKES